MSQTGPEPSEAKHYLVARLKERLAQDPRTNDLNITVTIAENKVFLIGKVTTDDRREAIARVAQEMLPGHEIHNEATVDGFGEPEGVEKLG
jgi:osmotically-inducible protein OsmY